jgi:NADPH-dependent 2,4-dienoyl-CoA reductase/sulfur reductase-like enzyme
VLVLAAIRRVGAARRLAKSDADVVLVDRHDYHTFQPLLYQLATGLLETTAVGHSLRDLLHGQDNATVHKTSVTGVDLAARRVTFEELEPLTYDYLVLGLGAEVNFFGTEGAAEHAFPMYTLPDAVRLKEHVLGRREAADKDPVWSRTAAQHRRRRRRPNGRRECRRAGRALPRLRRGLSEPAAGQSPRHPRRSRTGRLRDVQTDLRAY